MSLWANAAAGYRVAVPPELAPRYEYAAPLAISFAAVAFGLWLARRRRPFSVTGRLLLWTAAGSSAVGYTAWWIWRHNDNRDTRADLAANVANDMPLIWLILSLGVIAIGSTSNFRRSRGPTNPDGGTETGAEPPRR